MSEIIHTRCDTCPTTLNVDPDAAVELHGWMEDDYGGHFCIACQEVAQDLEDNAATPEDMGVFVEAIEEAATQQIKTGKKAKKN